jgi:trimeric autotransporter adhesin
VGFSALSSNDIDGSGAGNYNTAVGAYALGANTDGKSNTATGQNALAGNTTGYQNTASGVQALFQNTTGYLNTAFGFYALNSNIGPTTDNPTYGLYNAAVGANSLQFNTTGYQNTAVGNNALKNNIAGFANTAVGFNALAGNTSALTGNDNNTAFGANALYSNTIGKGNAAQGVNALYSNTTGIRNLGIGSNALYASNGSYNIALGFDAGSNVTTGSNNIEIGTPGTASDDNTIQIGVQGTQTQTTIAGIFGTPVIGSAVYVTSTGQLGVFGSSERFKTDIAPMRELSAKLGQLRPVTFHYKTDPKGIQQYGLIAEEVDRVYPELVIRDERGRIQGVHYEELAPMLLGELQKQQHVNAVQVRRTERQDAEIRELKQQVEKVNGLEHDLAEMRTALAALQSKDQLGARR